MLQYSRSFLFINSSLKKPNQHPAPAKNLNEKQSKKNPQTKHQWKSLLYTRPLCFTLPGATRRTITFWLLYASPACWSHKRDSSSRQKVSACIEPDRIRYSSGPNCQANLHLCGPAGHLLSQEMQTELWTLLGRGKVSLGRFTFCLGNEFSNKAKGEKICRDT